MSKGEAREEKRAWREGERARLNQTGIGAYLFTVLAGP